MPLRCNWYPALPHLPADESLSSAERTGSVVRFNSRTTLREAFTGVCESAYSSSTDATPPDEVRNAAAPSRTLKPSSSNPEPAASKGGPDNPPLSQSGSPVRNDLALPPKLALELEGAVSPATDHPHQTRATCPAEIDSDANSFETESLGMKRSASVPTARRILAWRPAGSRSQLAGSCRRLWVP